MALPIIADDKLSLLNWIFVVGFFFGNFAVALNPIGVSAVVVATDVMASINDLLRAWEAKMVEALQAGKIDKKVMKDVLRQGFQIRYYSTAYSSGKCAGKCSVLCTGR